MTKPRRCADLDCDKVCEDQSEERCYACTMYGWNRTELSPGSIIVCVIVVVLGFLGLIHLVTNP